MESIGLLYRSDSINVIGGAGQEKRCLTSCGVLPQSTQTSRPASFFWKEDLFHKSTKNINRNIYNKHSKKDNEARKEERRMKS